MSLVRSHAVDLLLINLICCSLRIQSCRSALEEAVHGNHTDTIKLLMEASARHKSNVSINCSYKRKLLETLGVTCMSVPSSFTIMPIL